MAQAKAATGDQHVTVHGAYTAQRALKSLFDAAEEFLAELEAVYNRIAFAPPMSLRRLNGMLSWEHVIWDQRLRRAEEDLQEQKMLACRPIR